jgi:predicted house-cleaning noncanonical NTP pyrophosphatase (MazG superfamily)
MSKLVRDRIRDILEPRNPRIVFSRVIDDQREGLLFSKLLEEAGEWLRVSRDDKGQRDKEQSLKELADLLEVVFALAKLDNISEAMVMSECLGKRMARGGFDQLLTMSVEADGDRPTRHSSIESPEPTTSFASGNFGTGGDGRWYSG